MLLVALTALGLSVTVPGRAAAQQRAGSIVGRVMNAQSGQPVDGAIVMLRFTGRRVTTDSAGRFALHGVAAGVGLLQARAIGYQMGSWAVTVTADDTVDDTLALEPVPVELSSLTVEAPPSDDWRSAAGFARRKAKGGGYFVTEEQINQQQPVTLVEVLRTIPGLTTRCDYFTCNVWMNRSPVPCRPEYFLDGYPATLATGPSFPIQGIRGIEIYPDVFSVPIEMQRINMSCGVIAIWTRMHR